MTGSPAPFTKPKRAAIYLRISDDKEGRELGVGRQDKDSRALCDREGYTVVAVYSDNDISASTNSRKPRPDWDRMLDDAEAGRFEVIVAYSSSRLTRRGREREDLLDLHDDYGTELHFHASGKPDLSTSSGRQMFMMMGTLDTAEPERTSELVRRKHLELAEAGRYNGPRPFGWDLVGKGADQRLVINQAEAAIIRECVDRVLRGEGLWRIRNDLVARGVTTTKGGPWQTQTLRRMLMRWTNCGYRHHQPTRRGKPHGKAALHEGQWEPVVDRETHERVIATLTDPARKSNNRGTEVRYLLTGILHCGACGRPVVGTAAFTYEVKGGLRKDGSRGPSKVRNYPRAYKCPHAGCMKVQRNMADVDDLVEKTVVRLLERDGVRVLGGNPAAVESARARIGALEAKLALATDKWSADLITDEQLDRISATIRPQLDAERARLRAAQPAEGLEQFAGPGAQVAWTAAHVETKRRILKVLGRAIDMTITLDRVGPGNGAKFDPESVRFGFTAAPRVSA